MAGNDGFAAETPLPLPLVTPLPLVMGLAAGYTRSAMIFFFFFVSGEIMLSVNEKEGVCFWF